MRPTRPFRAPGTRHGSDSCASPDTSRGPRGEAVRPVRRRMPDRPRCRCPRTDSAAPATSSRAARASGRLAGRAPSPAVIDRREDDRERVAAHACRSVRCAQTRAHALRGCDEHFVGDVVARPAQATGSRHAGGTGPHRARHRPARGSTTDGPASGRSRSPAAGVRIDCRRSRPGHGRLTASFTMNKLSLK